MKKRIWDMIERSFTKMWGYIGDTIAAIAIIVVALAAVLALILGIGAFIEYLASTPAIEVRVLHNYEKDARSVVESTKTGERMYIRGIWGNPGDDITIKVQDYK